MSDKRSDVHFGIAGILTTISIVWGVMYLMVGLAIPILPPNPLLMAFFAVTAVAIVYSMEESIRMIGLGIKIGWGLLLGNCCYAVMVAPIITVHVGLALEAVEKVGLRVILDLWF